MKILSGISFVATKNFFLQGVNLIVFVVLARFLTPSEIGIVSLGLAFVSFLQIFQDQGFQQAVVHSRATSNAYLSTAFDEHFSFKHPDGSYCSNLGKSCDAI